MCNTKVKCFTKNILLILEWRNITKIMPKSLLNSPCPKDELYEMVLQNDVVKIDGNMAIAWSGSLNFTVEKSGKSLIGSAASGEGLVNVYRGTGKILMAPTA